ncbi:MAG: LPS export ABC transporter periplasmic protein LptC [Alphaproteobacteria bacterium]
MAKVESRSTPDAETAARLAKAAAEAAAAAEKARAMARLRTASGFGTIDPRVLDATQRYSSVVGILKVALPLVALGIIATLIVYSVVSKPQNGISIRYANKGKEENTIVMESPRFIGTDKKNEPFEVVAIKARQNPDERSLIELTGVQGKLTLTSGLGLTVVADKGTLDTANRLLVLDGPITVTSSDGYKLTTSEARVDLQAGLLVGRRPILAVGPWGSLTASAFEADRDERTVEFAGRVSIHFSPASGSN